MLKNRGHTEISKLSKASICPDCSAIIKCISFNKCAVLSACKPIPSNMFLLLWQSACFCLFVSVFTLELKNGRQMYL